MKSNALYLAVSTALKSKAYPDRVRMFLGGLKASLLLEKQVSDIEKLIYYVYRTGYEMGAGEYGGDMEAIHDEMPTFGIDNVK